MRADLVRPPGIECDGEKALSAVRVKHLYPGPDRIRSVKMRIAHLGSVGLFILAQIRFVNTVRKHASFRQRKIHLRHVPLAKRLRQRFGSGQRLSEEYDPACIAVKAVGRRSFVCRLIPWIL